MQNLMVDMKIFRLICVLFVSFLMSGCIFGGLFGLGGGVDASSLSKSLLATNAGDAQIAVSWDQIGDANSYQLYKTEGIPFDVWTSLTFPSAASVQELVDYLSANGIAYQGVTVDGLAHDDTGLTNNLIYCYAVTGVSTEGEGAPSDVGCNVPLGSVALSSIAMSMGGSITWVPVEGAVGYHLYWQTFAAGGAPSLSAPPLTASKALLDEVVVDCFDLGAWEGPVIVDAAACLENECGIAIDLDNGCEDAVAMVIPINELWEPVCGSVQEIFWEVQNIFDSFEAFSSGVSGEAGDSYMGPDGTIVVTYVDDEGTVSNGGALIRGDEGVAGFLMFDGEWRVYEGTDFDLIHSVAMDADGAVYLAGAVWDDPADTSNRNGMLKICKFTNFSAPDACYVHPKISSAFDLLVDDDAGMIYGFGSESAPGPRFGTPQDKAAVYKFNKSLALQWVYASKFGIFFNGEFVDGGTYLSAVGMSEQSDFWVELYDGGPDSCPNCTLEYMSSRFTCQERDANNECIRELEFRRYRLLDPWECADGSRQCGGINQFPDFNSLRELIDKDGSLVQSNNPGGGEFGSITKLHQGNRISFGGQVVVQTNDTAEIAGEKLFLGSRAYPNFEQGMPDIWDILIWEGYESDDAASRITVANLGVDDEYTALDADNIYADCRDHAILSGAVGNVDESTGRFSQAGSVLIRYDLDADQVLHSFVSDDTMDIVDVHEDYRGWISVVGTKYTYTEVPYDNGGGSDNQESKEQLGGSTGGLGEGGEGGGTKPDTMTVVEPEITIWLVN